MAKEKQEEETITIEDLLLSLKGEGLITIVDLEENPLIAGSVISAMLKCYYDLSVESKIVVGQEKL